MIGTYCGLVSRAVEGDWLPPSIRCWQWGYCAEFVNLRWLNQACWGPLSVHPCHRYITVSLPSAARNNLCSFNIVGELSTKLFQILQFVFPWALRYISNEFSHCLMYYGVPGVGQRKLQ